MWSSVVVHVFHCSTWETEEGQSLSSRPACLPQQFQSARAPQGELVIKQTNQSARVWNVRQSTQDTLNLSHLMKTVKYWLHKEKPRAINSGLQLIHTHVHVGLHTSICLHTRTREHTYAHTYTDIKRKMSYMCLSYIRGLLDHDDSDSFSIPGKYLSSE